MLVTVPLHIVAGFLGAGKTTVLLHQLQQREDERVAVVVNDFGESAYDAERLGAGAPISIREIPGGCVCCTAPEGFINALEMLLETNPDRILVEPTGLALPGDLIDSVRRSHLAPLFDFRPVIVLVDPEAWVEAKQDPQRPARFGFVARQIEAADVLLASRCDLCGPESLEAFEAWAKDLWPRPLLLGRIEQGALPVEALTWPEQRPALRLSRAGHDGHSTSGFHVQSWTWPADARFSLARIREAVETLGAVECGARFERFKGVFHTNEGVQRVEWANGQTTARLTGYRRESVADLILSGDNLQLFERTKAAFTRALLDEAERTIDTSALEFVLPDGRRVRYDRDRLAALPDSVPDISALVPKRQGTAAVMRAVMADLNVGSGLEAVVVALDGYATPAVPFDALSEALVLHTLEGGPLPEDKGGPFRLLIPGDAGPAGACSNVKGVAQLVLRPSTP